MAVNHVSDHPTDFLPMVLELEDFDQFHLHLHYIILLTIPDISVTDLCDRYKKYGKVFHIFKGTRQHPTSSQTLQYAYIGYDKVSSVVRALKQGKYFIGFHMSPRLARWASGRHPLLDIPL